ncbi:MAG: hypothetical protein WKG07_30715 [Hymenobacter sp.]
MGSLRGFDVGGEPGDPDKPVHRFRPRMVREGKGGVRREFVEVLTAVDAGPLLLAWLYAPDPEAGKTGRAPCRAGAGGWPRCVGSDEPLRPLEAKPDRRAAPVWQAGR